MPRTLLLLVALMLLLPAGVAAEPTGDPYEIARASNTEVRVTSGRDGTVMASWIANPATSSSALNVRVLGRSSPLTPEQSLGGAFGGVVAANPRLGTYMSVWTALTSLNDIALYSRPLDHNRNASGAAQEFAPQPSGSHLPFSLEYNGITRQWLLTDLNSNEAGDYPRAYILNENGSPAEPWGVQVGDWSTGIDGTVRPMDGSHIVVWSEVEDTYASTWSYEIRGRILDRTGSPVGADFLISNHRNLVGRMENVEPRVAVDPGTNEALVVWSDRYEIFARRVRDGGQLLGSEVRVSRMGPPSDPAWITRAPDVAFSSGQYLVVWQSGPGVAEYPAGEVVYGQHLNRSGEQIGTNDFPIATRDRAVTPVVTPFAGGSDFAVVWSSQHASPSLWARRVIASSLTPPVNPPEDDPTPDRPPLTPLPPVQPPTAPANRAPDPTVPQSPDAPAPSAPSPISAPGGAPQGETSFAMAIRPPRTLGALVGRGLRVAVTCPVRCRATVRLQVAGRAARRLDVGTLARRTVRLARAGTTLVRLRPRRIVRKKVRKLRRLTVAIRVHVQGVDGGVDRLSRTVTLRR